MKIETETRRHPVGVQAGENVLFFISSVILFALSTEFSNGNVDSQIKSESIVGRFFSAGLHFFAGRGNDCFCPG